MSKSRTRKSINRLDIKTTSLEIQIWLSLNNYLGVGFKFLYYDYESMPVL